MDPITGSTIPDLSTKYSAGSMIPSHPIVKLADGYEIPLDPLNLDIFFLF